MASRAIALAGGLTADAERDSKLRPAGTEATQPAHLSVDSDGSGFAFEDEFLQPSQVEFHPVPSRLPRRDRSERCRNSGRDPCR